MPSETPNSLQQDALLQAVELAIARLAEASAKFFFVYDDEVESARLNEAQERLQLALVEVKSWPSSSR